MKNYDQKWVCDDCQAVLDNEDDPCACDSVGPTGAFPDGKLAPDDEGELGIRLVAFNGTIVLELGKPASWLGFAPKQAREIAAMLVDLADKIEASSPHHHETDDRPGD